MNNRFTQAALAACLIICCLMITACPKDTAVHKAARASFELAGLTHDVIAGVDRAYTENILSKDSKDKMALWLSTISRGGEHFNQIATQINANANVDQSSKLLLLNQVLSQQIVGPFLQILQEIGALNPGQAAYLTAAIAALRTAILTISAAVSQDTYQQLLRRPFAYA